MATLLQPVLTGAILDVIASGDSGKLRAVIGMLVVVLVLELLAITTAVASSSSA